MLDRVRARFGRHGERSAPALFTARTSPTDHEIRVRERVVPVDAPSVRVHADRLDRPRPRIELTPAQALELARDGNAALHRERPVAD